MNVTTDLLLRAVDCTPSTATSFAPFLDEVCDTYEIRTVNRMAAFLGETAHESAGFRDLEESLNYSVDALLSTFGRHRISAADAQRLGRYPGHPAEQQEIANLIYGGEWGRKNLGNKMPGDGWKYRARGLIGITGLDNCAKIRDLLRRKIGDRVPDFVEHPELLKLPEWASWSAGAYWDWRALNRFADAGDFLAISRAINLGSPHSTGMPIGNEQREKRRARALEALNGVPQASPSPTPESSRPAPIPPVPAPFATPQDPTDPEVQQAPPVQSPQPEKPMLPIAGAVLSVLADSLIEGFRSHSREKIDNEIARHSGSDQVKDQVSTVVLEAAKQITGLADPIQAVAAVRADPAVASKVEDITMDQLAKLSPLLDQLAQLDKLSTELTIQSQDAASARARLDPNDQDPLLTRSIISIMSVLLGCVGILIGVLAYFKMDSAVATLAGLFSVLAGGVATQFSNRYSHRYGSSSGSAAKDVAKDTLMGMLARK